MIIKSLPLPSAIAWIAAAAQALSRWRRLRMIIVAFLGLAAFGAVSIASLYIGIQIAGTSRATSLKGWLTFITGPKIEIAENYLRSFWVTPEHLKIDIKHANFLKLAHQRQQAIEVGFLLSPSESDWVPARIKHAGETYRVDLRLKGQEGDHWRDERQWSFKVKVKGDKTLFGMRRFALQAPRTRNFMNEWVFHRLLAHIDLIHLRYQFVTVSVNGEPSRVLAIEENFDKRLIENNRRREGPVFKLRMDRDRSLWRGLGSPHLVAPLEPYQETALNRSTGKRNAFQRAATLWEGFRLGRLTASQVFDTGAVGRLLALIDILGESHPLALRNIKFYYNPITGKIEPVAFDLTNIGSAAAHPPIGSGIRVGDLLGGDLDRSWFSRALADEEVFKAYTRALAKFTQTHFLDGFFDTVAEDFIAAMSVLSIEFPWYRFDRKILYDNQREIRGVLDQHRPVRAYAHEIDEESGRLRLTVLNIHHFPQEVLGLRLRSGQIQHLETPHILAGYDKERGVEPVEIVVDMPPNWQLPEDLAKMPQVEISLVGLTQVFSERVEASWRLHDWALAPLSGAHLSELLPKREFLMEDERTRTLTVRPGQWTVRRDLVIPAGYRVMAGPGTTLDLSGGASIISYSPLLFEGEEAAPVEIISSDGGGQGILVIGAQQPSQLSFVVFRNLTNPSIEGWVLTGAVTFYESTVEIDRCYFIDSRSEDALNIFRGPFNIANSTVIGALSDAIDIDFASGSIATSRFFTIGNDAIDISGSTVRLEDIRIETAGDKGISVGEKSKLHASRIDILNSEIAIAVKDSSLADFDTMSIEATRVGFAIFQKKPEFNAAVATVRALSMNKVDRPHLVQSGSSLAINGVSVATKLKNVEELLYGAQYGRASSR